MKYPRARFYTEFDLLKGMNAFLDTHESNSGGKKNVA